MSGPIAVWLTARTWHGTDAICVHASSPRTVNRFLRRAQSVGALISYVAVPIGRHWDGGKLDPVAARRVERGIRRNAGSHREEEDTPL